MLRPQEQKKFSCFAQSNTKYIFVYLHREIKPQKSCLKIFEKDRVPN
jgi:hypothetical protein